MGTQPTTAPLHDSATDPDVVVRVYSAKPYDESVFRAANADRRNALEFLPTPPRRTDRRARRRGAGRMCLRLHEEEARLFFQDRRQEVIDDDVFSGLLAFPNVLITAHPGVP